MWNVAIWDDEQTVQQEPYALWKSILAIEAFQHQLPMSRRKYQQLKAHIMNL